MDTDDSFDAAPISDKFVNAWLQSAAGLPVTLQLSQLVGALAEFLESNFRLRRPSWELDFSMFEQLEPEAPPVDLGPCCACGGGVHVRNLMMLPRLAPVVGKGWGCVQCGLPSDGAMAVLCDACVEAERQPVDVIAGQPDLKLRAPVGPIMAGPVFEHRNGCPCSLR